MMAVSVLWYSLLAPLAPNVALLSPLFGYRSDIVDILLEIFITMLLSIDYASLIMIAVQFVVVVKLTARAMGYDIVFRICD
ncbi:hypothetical protein Q1695_007752 [Nippostrongylus brasiliensis]|nr:hypothetical protein Q1695_007752 [Nippostrongylus brasiliensis]